MKAVIVFDSVYGYTKQVGEMIGSVLNENGWDIETVYLKDSKPDKVDADFVFIGSPTRFGKATRRVRKYLKNGLDGFSGTAVAFDTIMQIDENDPKAEKTKTNYIDNGAAPSTKETLSQNGIKVYDDLLRVEVTGLKGPLVDDAEDIVKAYVSKLLSSLEA